ncbi:hypothetical protein [Pseudomonas panipatensis]|uniref:hypothetical protein n=1 Tax=Pseudomonas panipatensis TaxID=428992 RepID=UPI0035AF8DB0
MSRSIRALLLSTMLVLAAGCTSQPIQNIERPLPADSNRTPVQVQAAIVESLSKLKWQVQRSSTDTIYAEITVRGRHHAEITIPFSSQNYAINYRSSSGLDEKNGKIHRNYNKWVSILDKNIQGKLNVSPQPSE